MGLRAYALIALVGAFVGACGPSPLLPMMASPSPTVLQGEMVAVGSVVSCEGAVMRRHCDGWIAAARGAAGLAWADVAAATVHVGWSTVPRTMAVSIVVELALRNGSVLFEPIFCGPGPDPEHICDLSDASLPAK